MKVLILEDDLVDYGVHLVGARLASGFVAIPELPTIQAFHTALIKAQPIDFSNLGKMTLDKIGPGGVSLGFDVDPNLRMPGVICPDCHATPCNCPTGYVDGSEVGQEAQQAKNADAVDAEVYDSGHPDQPLVVVPPPPRQDEEFGTGATENRGVGC